MNRKKIGLGLWVLLVVQIAVGQQKRSLTHADYDGWESLSSAKITKNGLFVGYQISPQDGDGRFEVFPYKNPDQKTVISRASAVSFTPDDAFLVGKIVPQKDSVRVLKLKKKKNDDLPKDSLFIFNLASGAMEKLPRVKSFGIPTEKGSWIAIHFEKELPQKPDPADSTKKAEKPKKTDGTKLLVRSLDGSKSWEFDRVKSYSFAPNGDYFQYTLAEEDTLDNSAVFVLNLSSGESKLVLEKMTTYSDLTFSPQSSNLALIATDDSLKAKKPVHSLYLYDVKSGAISKKLEKTDLKFNQGRISPDGNIRFSEDENKLFFGVAQDYKDYAYAEDTTILDEERVSLDIWGWQDDEIQPMQLKNKSQEEKKTYWSVLDLSSGQITQLTTPEVDNLVLENKITKNIALAWTDAPYRRSYSWDIQIGRDLYWVDFSTGQKTLIEKNASGFARLSPEANYAYWYDGRDSSWVAYDLKAKSKINLTKALPIPFYEELHDSPSLPGSYGAVGWMAGDQAILINDRYDIWKIDPKNPSAAINLTQGEGRKNAITFRRETLDFEERAIDPKAPFLLSAFNEVTKDNGFYMGSLDGKSAPKQLLMTAHNYSGLLKAKESNQVLVRRSTYQDNPDVYLTDLNFKSLQKASNLNPQQANIKWGSVELVSYLTLHGDPLQGLLFKPEGFDPSKKYPMMVYFYERNSDTYHNYRAPAPSRSTINIPYFVSNDYLVFVPDIKYEMGLPGPSAYDCIIPGVQAVIAKGGVDTENMAIQGQSWGGYQVAYLITQTNMFKAAGAGAPVVNMTSAYGGIRWGTGMSRMFQYEQTQSRIGGTLWDKPLYYLENSPLFMMDRVQTPVLIMHNDEDGAVPWYQGIEMFMALKRLNKPAWLLQYNGEDHNLTQRKNAKDLSVRLSQFFDHYLKGAPTPLWMSEGLPAVEKGKTLKYELGD
ncbi:dipeptidyl aminopeptidase/acylaminoacyl peptidase [Algoriphagus boseongensis]|uniref:Dipeptidyl aminopeptidase/acylaminoacyl peptidase n=1 Tax=Algoriphagus boseongensis TaxID=1442587 RepID=A0A4R6TBR6_9BACT|nr:prolyl oligopeptidase family serine peptidase [Algoriphagus boseongensis]TDQ19659.1 dipeptidyl aminopeptidase/acylaminoacyl peptidase [Algoriphagus boseongensis]